MSDLDLSPDAQQLAEIILPELVWEKILKFLTDHDDILNSGKTCTLFQLILKCEIATVYFNKALPVLMKYMDSESILKCRLVSRGWKDGVDNQLLNLRFNRGACAEIDWANLRLLGFRISLDEEMSLNTPLADVSASCVII